MEECPCGADFPYTDCCGRLLRGTAHADTAEELMRSRYTAFTRKNWQYVIDTTCSAERAETESRDFESAHQDIHWEKLEVLETRDGGFEDEKGEVTFLATYLENGKKKTLQETSRFLRENGRWTYSEKNSKRQVAAPGTGGGKPFVRSEAKVGRNDPCPCGSAKKFKKCCGK